MKYNIVRPITVKIIVQYFYLRASDILPLIYFSLSTLANGNDICQTTHSNFVIAQTHLSEENYIDITVGGANVLLCNPLEIVNNSMQLLLCFCFSSLGLKVQSQNLFVM